MSDLRSGTMKSNLMSHEQYEQHVRIIELTVLVGTKFPTFGGGKADDWNPISSALRGGPLRFHSGVHVEDVVRFIVENLYAPTQTQDETVPADTPDRDLQPGSDDLVTDIPSAAVSGDLPGPDDGAVLPDESGGERVSEGTPIGLDTPVADSGGSAAPDPIPTSEGG